MAIAEPLRMSITLDRGAVPVSGCLTPRGGPERAFTGWTELFAALQTAIAEDNIEEEVGGQDL